MDEASSDAPRRYDGVEKLVEDDESDDPLWDRGLVEHRVNPHELP
jgi:hypothetical protein